MSAPVVPVQTKRFAALIDRPGGLTEDEAVAGATANLEASRGRTLQALADLVQQMQTLGRNLGTPPDQTTLNQLYVVSNSVMSVAGIFGLHCLSAVAYSLCELLDRLRTSESWNFTAVRIHLDSLRLLQTTEPPPAEARAIREALKHLVDHVAEQVA